MDFTSLPPPRPPPRLGLPRAILSNLAASGALVSCKFVFKLLQLSKYLSKSDESDLFWKFSKLSFPATFAQQAKTRKYLPKESRNLLVEISAFHAGMNWMIDFISDWLVLFGCFDKLWTTYRQCHPGTDPPRERGLTPLPQAGHRHWRVRLKLRTFCRFWRSWEAIWGRNREIYTEII